MGNINDQVSVINCVSVTAYWNLLQQYMANGVTGLHGHSVLALAANQYRLDRAHVPHHSTKAILVKDLQKNSKNVSYDLVKVSNSSRN